MRVYVVVVALLAIIFGSIAAYLNNKWSTFAEMDFSPPPVTIAAGLSKAESWGQYIKAVGTIKAKQGIELTSEQSGQITAVRAESGDKVKAGQILIELNSNVEHAALLRQKASAKLAQLNFKRDKKLLAQNSISQTHFDRSLADLEKAQAQLAETKARLANKIIRAPFDGTIGILEVELGDYVSPGTTIVSLQDLSALQLDFNVPSQIATQLKVGMDIEFTVSAYSDKLFTAKITAVNPKIEPNTRNLKVRAAITIGAKLVPGMFAQLSVITAEKTSVITVPESSISYSLHGNMLHLIEATEDGNGLTTNAIIVKTGQVRNSNVRLLSPIPIGKKVVTAGQNKLYPGVRILIDEKVKL